MCYAPHPHPARAAFPAQRLHCDARPSSWWGWPGVAGGPEQWLLGPEWQWGEAGRPSTAHGNTQVPGQAWSPLASLPCLSCRGVEGSGDNLGFLPPFVGGTQLSGEGLALRPGSL